MRSLVGFLGLVVSAFACGSPASPAALPAASVRPPASPSWKTLRAAARQSREAKDYAGYRARLLELYALSGSAYVGYELARAEALLGHADAALDRLRTYAAAGLVADLGDDAALAVLKDEPKMEEIRRRMEANRTPIAHASPVFALPHEDLITEDVAFDPASHTFYVSSVRHKKIVAVDEHGARDFVASGAGGVGALCGLALRGGRLWATTAALPPMLGFAPAPAHPTAVLAYDLRTAALLERIELAADGAEHTLTDLTVGPGGDVFASDATGGGVYVVPRGAHRLEPLVPAGIFVSPQTPAATPDGKCLFVPDYVRGVAKVLLATGSVSWLAHAPEIALNGIDGLYLVGETSLVAIQNGTTPPRIVRLTLGADGSRVERVEVLEQGTPGLGEPTHGVVVGEAFYFLANAGWNRFADDGSLAPDAPPDAPELMQLRLR